MSQSNDDAAAALGAMTNDDEATEAVEESAELDVTREEVAQAVTRATQRRRKQGSPLATIGAFATIIWSTIAVAVGVVMLLAGDSGFPTIYLAVSVVLNLIACIAAIAMSVGSRVGTILVLVIAALTLAGWILAGLPTTLVALAQVTLVIVTLVAAVLSLLPSQGRR